MITVEQVRNNPQVRTYIQKADEALAALGYTEHSFAHVGKVAKEAREILLTLGYSPREAELAEIAGWLHDIGNVINRVDHAQSGAVMAFRILDKLGAEAEEISTIISAIGNHDESTVMDYFEIFMQRMLLCRKAAEKLGLTFSLVINDQIIL